MINANQEAVWQEMRDKGFQTIKDQIEGEMAEAGRPDAQIDARIERLRRDFARMLAADREVAKAIKSRKVARPATTGTGDVYADAANRAAFRARVVALAAKAKARAKTPMVGVAPPRQGHAARRPASDSGGDSGDGDGGDGEPPRPSRYNAHRFDRALKTPTPRNPATRDYLDDPRTLEEKLNEELGYIPSPETRKEWARLEKEADRILEADRRGAISARKRVKNYRSGLRAGNPNLPQGEGEDEGFEQKFAIHKEKLLGALALAGFSRAERRVWAILLDGTPPIRTAERLGISRQRVNDVIKEGKTRVAWIARLCHRKDTQRISSKVQPAQVIWGDGGQGAFDLGFGVDQ